MATTIISTESARPSLTQTIEQLYSTLHAGGAYDVKKQLVLNGTHNGLTAGIQSQQHTPKGFKTKMSEQQSEMYMARDNKTITTRMRTSVYGDHSNKKYWNM